MTEKSPPTLFIFNIPEKLAAHFHSFTAYYELLEEIVAQSDAELKAAYDERHKYHQSPRNRNLLTDSEKNKIRDEVRNYMAHTYDWIDTTEEKMRQKFYKVDVYIRQLGASLRKKIQKTNGVMKNIADELDNKFEMIVNHMPDFERMPKELEDLYQGFIESIGQENQSTIMWRGLVDSMERMYQLPMAASADQGLIKAA